MPSLAETYSNPEDIAAYTRLTRLYKDYLPPAPVPLREHGPEPDDRFCRKHYQPETRYSFVNFACDLRFNTKCRDCENEELQAWLEEVRCKFQRGLVAAARGERVVW
jgi:hypothetical protein